MNFSLNWLSRDGKLLLAARILRPFVLGGVIKIIYDLALYFNFRNIKSKE
jgi:hypothetical protein